MGEAQALAGDVGIPIVLIITDLVVRGRAGGQIDSLHANACGGASLCQHSCLPQVHDGVVVLWRCARRSHRRLWGRWAMILQR